MNTLTWYGLGALALLAPTFYLVHRIAAYLALSAVIIVGFVGLTIGSVDWSAPSEWLVMTLGLALSVFGLMIVRVMLVRSVSLLLLGEIDAGRPGRMEERLGNRPHDMRKVGLIRSANDVNLLTPLGSFVSAVVATLYSVFGVSK